jgi:hypothetical protein
MLKIQKEMKEGLNSLNRKISLYVRKEVGSMQGIILTQIGEKVQFTGININNLRIEKEKLIRTGFRQLFDGLKKEIMYSNDILMNTIKENKINDEWFIRIENNLSIIFGDMKNGKKKKGTIEGLLKTSY